MFEFLKKKITNKKLKEAKLQDLISEKEYLNIQLERIKKKLKDLDKKNKK